MRPVLCFLILPAFLLASCAEWERPGATPQMRDAAVARCEAGAYAKFGAEPITVMTDAGGWVPGTRECRGEGPGRRCNERQGYHRPPSYGTRDANAPAREALVNDCMRRDGWVLR